MAAKKTNLTAASVALLLMSGAASGADPIKVTPDNFVRAESDMYMAASSGEAGLGKLFHRREPFDVKHQTVVRGNRDTLYSSGVFDLDAGPVTISMPDAGKRFMSLMVVNEDHYVTDVFHGAGSHTFTRDGVGTRYVLIAVRTLIDPTKSGDADEVHRLQMPSISINQAGLVRWTCPSGTRRARIRCAMRCSRSIRQWRVSTRPSAGRARSIPFIT